MAIRTAFTVWFCSQLSTEFLRLTGEGHSDVTARRMIGCVLMAKTIIANKKNTVIDLTQLRAELARLPKLGLAPGGKLIDIRGIE